MQRVAQSRLTSHTGQEFAVETSVPWSMISRNQIDSDAV